MKTKLLISVLALLPTLSALGQFPQGFNYQAIARNSEGNPIAGATIKLKISVLSDTTGFYSGTGGTYIWEEEHIGVKTNAFGLFTVVLGDPSATKSQGSAGSFSAIDWSPANLFIGVKVANPTDYKVMGSAKLWSVPFALRAKDSEQWQSSGSNLFRTSGNIGFGTANPGARLTVGENLGGTAASATLKTNAGLLGTTSGSTLKLASIGFTSSNQTSLGIEARRTIAGTDWNSTAIGLKYDVDNTSPVYNSEIWLTASGKVGIGTVTPSGKFSIQPPASWDDNTPLFEVKNKYGYPVLAVYNNGVRILVEDVDGKGGLKSGFAIGGFDQSKAGETYNLMIISPDSVRFMIDNTESKAGLKGGFAIGGFDATKASLNTRGFMHLTPQASTTTGNYNTFLGYQAGKKNDGLYNVFLGYEAGFNKRGSKNYIIGYHAGYNAGSGNSNVFIGDSTGFSTAGSYNVFIGNQAGKIGSSSYNTYLGYKAGYQNSSVWNVFIGQRAGQGLTSTNNSVIIGSDAAAQGTGGNYNVIIGRSAGSKVAYSNNVFIGYQSGYSNSTGSDNTFVGHRSGSSSSGSSNICIGTTTGNSSTGSDNIYIGNGVGNGSTNSDELIINKGDAPAPLIFGNLSNRRLIITGRDAQNPNSRTFYVNGTAGGDYAWYNDSDEKLKKDIITIPAALEKVLQLRGVNFYWREPSIEMEGMQMGFIGQEAIKVIPEVVSVANDNYSMQYAPITALLVEAVKELQKRIQLQDDKIVRLEKMVEELVRR